MNIDFRPRITLFHCVNTFADQFDLPDEIESEFELKIIKMACSSMVKDVFLLRAFESGSDAVVVMVCPKNHCRYIEGNIRANKRVNWVKDLLDEIGIDGKRLSLHNISAGDMKAAIQIVEQVVLNLKSLGPNPAK